DPLFLMFLDSAVQWAEDLSIYLIIDNHTFDPAVNTDPAVGDILVKVWVQLASRYANTSDKILYEVLNEPHGIVDAVWGSIQQRVIDTIRTVDNQHTIVVGGADWNGINGLNALPLYTDDNLLYTFHFYDPFIFTHQGASWVLDEMVDLRDVPFPYAADSMPAFPSSLMGTWIEGAFNNYVNEGNATAMGQQLDIVQQFVQARNVPVFCGEFGVFIPNSQPDDRKRWYEATRKALEDRGISWTIWDYKGGFGIFEPGGNDLFDHDLNVELIQSLGLQVPPQTHYISLPDTAGLFLYRDFVEKGVEVSSWISGGINLCQDEQTAFGQYVIEWTSGNRYESLNLDFVPNKDLSYLLSQDFALDFFIRSSNPNMEIDVRFLDTKTSDPNDHPWRMRYQLNASNVVLDGTWQHLYIPLSDFVEHGSWDNNQWYNPQGLFDWQAIDYLEFVLEEGALQGPISFDQIQLTDQDTATVGIE
ncbi:MAG: glycoside hydrolase family 5 protein, partial [Bacteroidota bacterium]